MVYCSSEWCNLFKVIFRGFIHSCVTYWNPLSLTVIWLKSFVRYTTGSLISWSIYNLYSQIFPSNFICFKHKFYNLHTYPTPFQYLIEPSNVFKTVKFVFETDAHVKFETNLKKIVFISTFHFSTVSKLPLIVMTCNFNINIEFITIFFIYILL